MKEVKDLLRTTTDFSVFLLKKNQNVYYADVKNLCMKSIKCLLNVLPPHL